MLTKCKMVPWIGSLNRKNGDGWKNWEIPNKIFSLIICTNVNFLVLIIVPWLYKVYIGKTRGKVLGKSQHYLYKSSVGVKLFQNKRFSLVF